jgi:hypothetical protein
VNIRALCGLDTNVTADHMPSGVSPHAIACMSTRVRGASIGVEERRSASEDRREPCRLSIQNDRYALWIPEWFDTGHA